MIGARLIPSVCSPESPPGEKLIFEALQADAGAQGWVVLHSLDLVRHVAKLQGEADFVVIVPGQGVLVLEVKSHKKVKRDEQGWWLGNEPVDIRGPFKQASQAMHSVREYLKGAGFDTDGIPFISAVAFTSVSFNIKSSEWHPWQVLDLQALNARSISKNVLQILKAARDLFASKGMRWAAWTRSPDVEAAEDIARILRPRFEFLANPANAMKELKTSLLRCTEQQFRFLDNVPDNDRLIVNGLAGTGKTTLAVEALRRERAANPDSRAALFCFNRLLGDKLRSDCAAIFNGAKIGSFHQWMLEFLDYKPGANEASDPEFWARHLPDKVLEALMSVPESAGVLDLLILDEAQDLLTDPYLDIFDLLLKNGLKGGRWLFFGDFDRQVLFARGTVSVKDFRTSRATCGCGSLRLDVNCRNTLEISTMLTTLAQLKPGYASTLRGDSHNDPEVIFYGNREFQLEFVTETLDRLLGSGFKPEEIILLSPYAEKSLARALAQLPRWAGRLGVYPAGKNKINYSTVHAFKGLESPAVILTDIDNIEDAGRLDLFYVGMSRALDRLHIFAHQAASETIKKTLQ